MIKVIEARYLGEFQVALNFSDGREGVFDGRAILERSGTLLAPLRSEDYFQRLFSAYSLMPVHCAGRMAWSFLLLGFMKRAGRWNRSESQCAQ